MAMGGGAGGRALSQDGNAHQFAWRGQALATDALDLAGSSPAEADPASPEAEQGQLTVGDLIVTSARLRRRPGVVVGVSDEQLQVVTTDGVARRSPADRVSVLRSVDQRDLQRPPASRALETIDAANRSDQRRLRFDDSSIPAVVEALIATDTDLARATVLDLLLHERHDLIANMALPIPPVDVEQLRSVARRWGLDGWNEPATAGELDALEPVLPVLVARHFSTLGGTDPTEHPLIGPLLAGRGRGALADALRCLAGADVTVDWAEAATELLGLLAGQIPDERYQAGHLLTSNATSGDRDLSELGPAAAVHAAAQWLEGRAPRPEHLDQATALGAPLGLVEALIGAGMLDAEGARRHGGGDASYVLGRLDPAALSSEALQELGHTSEIARRHFVGRERDELAGLASEGPGVRAHQARDLIRQGCFDEAAALTAGDGHDPDAAAVHRLANTCRTGDIVQLGELAQADPTLYPLVADLVPLAEMASLPATVRDVVLLRQGLAQLFDWDFEGVVERARAIVLQSSDDLVRQEAFNLMACAHWHLENDEAAIRALGQAAEIGLNESLLVNVGVVTAELNPSVASQHLTRLIEIAPDPQLKVDAARRAATLWQSQPAPAGDDGGEGGDVPAALREALRAIVTTNIDLGAFRDIADFVASHDSEWFNAGAWRSGSPHASTPEARVLAARVDGSRYVEALKHELDQSAGNRWLKRQATDLITRVITMLYSRAADVDASGTALLLLSLGYDVTPIQRVQLAAAGTIKATEQIPLGQAEPAEAYLTQLLRAEGVLDGVPQQSRSAAEELLRNAFTAYADHFSAYRSRALAEMSTDSLTADAREDRIVFCLDTSRIIEIMIPRAAGHMQQQLSELLRTAHARVSALTAT
jgi:hypothetical protein